MESKLICIKRKYGKYPAKYINNILDTTNLDIDGGIYLLTKELKKKLIKIYDAEMIKIRESMKEGIEHEPDAETIRINNYKAQKAKEEELIKKYKEIKKDVKEYWAMEFIHKTSTTDLYACRHNKTLSDYTHFAFSDYLYGVMGLYELGVDRDIFEEYCYQIIHQGEKFIKKIKNIKVKK